MVYRKTIDEAALRRDLAAVSSWDDWERVRIRVFGAEAWPERDLGAIEADLSRAVVTLNGHSWQPYAGMYDVDPALELLFEQSRWAVFARLEPHADRDNRAHPERFGWKCIYCRIYTRSHVDCCDRCGRRLVPMPLNEEERGSGALAR